LETLLPLDADNTYDLRSVIVHHGDAGGGHYTAFVRAQDNLWYHCNDEAAPRTCSTEQALRAQAYMLVYERR
jgi:ubiquitin C-terminal hydrolase